MHLYSSSIIIPKLYIYTWKHGSVHRKGLSSSTMPCVKGVWWCIPSCCSLLLQPIRGEHCGHVTSPPPITAHLSSSTSRGRGVPPAPVTSVRCAVSSPSSRPSTWPIRKGDRGHVTSSPPITAHLAHGPLAQLVQAAPLVHSATRGVHPYLYISHSISDQK